jgi:hypothetical protein
MYFDSIAIAPAAEPFANPNPIPNQDYSCIPSDPDILDMLYPGSLKFTNPLYTSLHINENIAAPILYCGVLLHGQKRTETRTLNLDNKIEYKTAIRFGPKKTDLLPYSSLYNGRIVHDFLSTLKAKGNDQTKSRKITE